MSITICFDINLSECNLNTKGHGNVKHKILYQLFFKLTLRSIGKRNEEIITINL